MHAYKLTYYIAYADGTGEAWQDFLNTRGWWHPIDAAKRFKFVAAEIAA